MKTIGGSGWILLTCACIIGGAIVAGLNVLADVPPPAITIAPQGSNQFSITITNGLTNINYEVYWQPVLGNPNYPWQLVNSGGQGQTNWLVTSPGGQAGFFRVAVGNDWDGDGIPNGQDANPYDPGVGILTITIDTPTNGFTFN